MHDIVHSTNKIDKTDNYYQLHKLKYILKKDNKLSSKKRVFFLKKHKRAQKENYMSNLDQFNRAF